MSPLRTNQLCDPDLGWAILGERFGEAIAVAEGTRGSRVVRLAPSPKLLAVPHAHRRLFSGGRGCEESNKPAKSGRR